VNEEFDEGRGSEVRKRFVKEKKIYRFFQP